ncbi:MAG: nitroreductase family protein [Lentimicrobiaceae bacterium]|nr:nitroreductase family protein [Lentimicrobiaceae bacterium]MCB9023698.1 nitroreductase family protein [Lentimicrobiaceae bacterium]MCO5266861.1 nitroreductase family protein [Lentimicrobium sp.]HPG33160.1 nitroreductase family protein [Lentimicrobium sp.]
MHIKTASTEHPIHDILRDRWSPRAFNGQTIENKQLLSLFEAARWTPSASNIQPWSFIIGKKGDDTYNKINQTLVEFNQLWATTAPVLMLAIAQTTNSKKQPNISALYDLGQSVASLTFQAGALGLYVHQMGGFNTSEAARLFEIPEDYTVATAIAIGHLGDPAMLHENLQKMETAPRQRRQANEFVFGAKFGQPSEIFNQQ